VRTTMILQMEECAYCLHNLSPTSLVIIDELGRGIQMTACITRRAVNEESVCRYFDLGWCGHRLCRLRAAHPVDGTLRGADATGPCTEKQSAWMRGNRRTSFLPPTLPT
jgi:hypothetical protein